MNEKKAPKRKGKHLYGWVPPIRSLTFIFAVWAFFTYSGYVAPFFLPPPHKVFTALIFLVRERAFLADVGASLGRILLGFLFSTLLAVPLGIIMGTTVIIRKHVEPVISAMRYIPAVALIPLCILWFGIGEMEKVVVIVLGTFFQLTILVMDEVLSVPRAFKEVAQVFGGKTSKILRYVVIPAASPGIFDACRVIFGWSWTYVVVAEIVGAASGIGHTILESQRFLRTDQVFAGILVIGLLGILTDFTMIILHRRLYSWTEKANVL
jgi:NitT/TauT family transport system permease protein